MNEHRTSESGTMTREDRDKILDLDFGYWPERAQAVILSLAEEIAQTREHIWALYETWDPEPPASGPLYELAVLTRHPDA